MFNVQQWRCRQHVPDGFSASELSQAPWICCSQSSPSSQRTKVCRLFCTGTSRTLLLLHRDTMHPSAAAQGHHAPFCCCTGTPCTLLLLPPHEHQALQERSHQGKQWHRREPCAWGHQGQLIQSHWHSIQRLFLAADRVAIGRVLSHEECSQERNKSCWSGTGLPASCWHPDLRPQQIIQSADDRELTDLGQKGSELT